MSRTTQCGKEFPPFRKIVFGTILEHGMVVYMKYMFGIIFYNFTCKPVQIPGIVVKQKTLVGQFNQNWVAIHIKLLLRIHLQPFLIAGLCKISPWNGS